jgi:hypothetical protein
VPAIKCDRASDRDQVLETVTQFHFHLARFLRAALAPFLPRAVRVFLGRCAIVFFRRAACAAFLIFRFAAVLCFLVVTSFRSQTLRGKLFFAPRGSRLLSVVAFWCAPLFSRRLSAIESIFASLLASRVWTMLASMLNYGSRV